MALAQVTRSYGAPFAGFSFIVKMKGTNDLARLYDANSNLTSDQGLALLDSTGSVTTYIDDQRVYDFGVYTAAGAKMKVESDVSPFDEGTSPQALTGTLQYQAPLTGVTFAIPAGSRTVVTKPAGTIAAHTMTFPAGSDKARITLAFTQIVTSLTLTPASGETIANGLTAATAGGFGTWEFRTADLTWYRVG